MVGTYSKVILSDGEAKGALRRWPLRPRSKAWGWASGKGCGPWVRALPMDLKTAPNKLAELRVVGLDDAATQPDGLWLSLGPAGEFVDIVAIEHCGSRQNFYDKRSRYMPNLHSRMLLLPDGWLEQEVTVQAGGQKLFRDVCAKFPAGLAGEQRLPVRHLRVLYALRPRDYDTLHLTPFSAHEFFCPHSALVQMTSPKLREFVKRLSTDVHWYTR